MLSYICWMYNSFSFGSFFCNDSLEVVKNIVCKTRLDNRLLRSAFSFNLLQNSIRIFT